MFVLRVRPAIDWAIFFCLQPRVSVNGLIPPMDPLCAPGMENTVIIASSYNRACKIQQAGCNQVDL